MNKAWIERAGLVLSFIGLALIFQPFDHRLLYYGFIIVGLGGFTYVYSTYLSTNPGGHVKLSTMVKWLFLLVGVVVFFVILSINLVPVLVV